MAVTTEELKTVLTVDGSKADSELRKHATNIENFGKKAEKAGTSGNRLSESLGGMEGRAALAGRAIGIAGVAIAGAAKFALDASEKFSDARAEIDHLARVPASGIFRNLGEAETHLSNVTDKLDELRIKRAQLSLRLVQH